MTRSAAMPPVRAVSLLSRWAAIDGVIAAMVADCAAPRDGNDAGRCRPPGRSAAIFCAAIMWRSATTSPACRRRAEEADEAAQRRPTARGGSPNRDGIYEMVRPMLS